MQRSSMKTTTAMAGGVSTLKPPKPPCWRDFVAPGQRGKDQTKTQDHSDTGKLHNVKSGVHDCSDSKIPTPQGRSGLQARAGKGLKRIRAKIHRTRSQHVIDEEDLPDCTLTMTLAETRPQEFGLGARQPLDDRLYREENTRRCQSWLESIEACEPLDEIAYTGGSGGEEGVDVEVPEETRWSEDGEPLRPPFNTSASSSEEQDEFDSTPLHEVAVSVSSPSSLRSNRWLLKHSEKSVHDKLIRKKTLHISDTGLE